VLLSLVVSCEASEESTGGVVTALVLGWKGLKRNFRMQLTSGDPRIVYAVVARAPGLGFARSGESGAEWLSRGHGSTLGSPATILAEYTSTSGNFPTVTRMLLDKIDVAEDSRRTYIYDAFAFHFIVENGIVYLCLCDEDLRRNVAFTFLEDIKERFKASYGEDYAAKAPPFAMNEDYSRVLRKQMEYYSKRAEHQQQRKSGSTFSSNRAAVSGEVLRNALVENVEKLLHQGEKIELLVDECDRSEHTSIAVDMESRTRRSPHPKMCVRISLAILFLFAFVLLIILGLPHVTLLGTSG